VSTFVYDKDKKQHDQHSFLASDELDLVRIYVYTFHQLSAEHSHISNFMRILNHYIRKIIKDRYRMNINMMADVNQLKGTFRLCINVNSSSACIYDNGRFYMERFVGRGMLRDIIEILGSKAYGAALALIELFSNNPSCIYECSSYINGLIRQLNRVRYFPQPDLDAYNLVKELFNKNVVPFESAVNIDYDTHREISEKIESVIKRGLHRILDNLGTYNIDQDIMDVIVESIYDGIYIDFILPGLSRVTIGFYIEYKGEPKLHMNISTKFSHDIDRETDAIVNIISNWYSYVVKAIEETIKKLDAIRIKKNIDSNKIESLKDYVRFWLNIVSRYRDEFEKNKIYR